MIRRLLARLRHRPRKPETWLELQVREFEERLRKGDYL